jgi:Protein of unknown function (DUF3723)
MINGGRWSYTTQVSVLTDASAFPCLSDSEDKISSAELRQLREEYDNARAPSDGTIFCAIHRANGDQKEVNSLLAKWSECPTKIRDLDRLQNKKEFANLKQRLYNLTPFPALFSDLEFGLFVDG